MKATVKHATWHVRRLVGDVDGILDFRTLQLHFSVDWLDRRQRQRLTLNLCRFISWLPKKKSHDMCRIFPAVSKTQKSETMSASVNFQCQWYSRDYDYIAYQRFYQTLLLVFPAPINCNQLFTLSCLHWIISNLRYRGNEWSKSGNEKLLSSCGTSPRAEIYWSPPLRPQMTRNN